MVMRKREIIIWLILILLGMPVCFFALNDISPLVDHIGLLATALLISSLIVSGWRLKKRLKGRMEEGLSREVEDGELTSIATWMKIPDHAGRAAREAERFSFDE
ncbi:MAG TPA: hypothetical protein VE262_12030 [Blastocatellia bacterium]|nr:hypothetical protein [Blastocatellia bacterium]